MKIKPATEKQIQNAILQWLNLQRNVFAFRQNSGIFFITQNNKTRAIKAGIKGVSDIIGICKKRFLAIEVKSKTGKLSDDQKLFLDKISKLGGIAFCAHSLEDVENNLKNYI